MARDRLRVALVGGPMYDSLYEPFVDDVEVVVHADHPTLNRRVAALLADGERIDVLSTHGKYAPSQAQWLRPLDPLLDEADVGALAPRAVELCRFRGDLLCAPRNIDVRVLWWRTDRMPEAPRTWADLVASDAVFGFTGRESGLFGLFFELVVGYGGALFDTDARPTMTGPEAEAAIALLCELARRAPDDLPDWHYDQVDVALLDGRVDCAAAWPGGYGAIRASSLHDVLRPAPYMGGPSARVSYSGVHAWAIPTTCGDLDGAVDLVTRLCSAEFHEREANAGGIPARVDVMQSADADDDRLRITRETIDEAMITYPPLVRFPEVEDAGWGAIHDALTGALAPAEAVQRIQVAAESALARVISLGLGCAPIGNMFDVVDEDDAIAVVHAAYDTGIRLFDTAPLYGHGLSERRLGAALASLPRDEITVATKVGRVLVADEPGPPDGTIFVDVPPVHPVFDFSADGTRRSLGDSLERLGLDRVDIVHVHDPDDHCEDALAGAFPVLRQWRDEGVVGRIGAGMNQSAMLARFVREADVDCVLLAGRYTLLDQSALDDLLPLCKETGVAVFAGGVFNSGVLANPEPGAPYDYAPAPTALVARAQQLAAICARHDVPLTAAALQFPARHPAVECVLTGVRSVAELQANVAAAGVTIPDALWEDLRPFCRF